MLEQHLKETNAYLKELNDRLGQILEQSPFAAAVTQPAPVDDTPEQTKDVPVDDTPEQTKDVPAPEITLQQVREALRAYSKEHGRDAAVAALKSVGGVEKVTDLKPDEYEALLVQIGATP